MNNPKMRALLIQFMTDMLALLQSETAVTMTGQQFIDAQDNPATGAPVAAEVFGADVAAQVFNHAAEVFGSPIYQMTPVAGAFTREQYHAQGWTDAQLIDGGYMVDVTPKPAPAPAPSIAVAGTALNAPVAPPHGSTPAAPAPSTPAPPPASVATTAAAPAPAGLPPAQVDSTGLPWDGRIHASTRTMTQKNVWKQRKGVDDATIAAVTAELRAGMSAPAAVPFTPLNAPAAPQAPAAPKAPPAPGAPAAPAAPRVAPVTFVELCRYTQSRALPAARILEVCNKFGLPGLGTVASREDLIPQIFAEFELQ